MSLACIHVHIINIKENKVGEKQSRAEQNRDGEKGERKKEKKATEKEVIAVAVHLLGSRTD